MIIVCIASPPWLVLTPKYIMWVWPVLPVKEAFLPNCSSPQTPKSSITHLPPNHTKISQSVTTRADWTAQIYTHKILFRAIVFKTLYSPRIACVLRGSRLHLSAIKRPFAPALLTGKSELPSLKVLSSLLFIGAPSFWHPQILSTVIAYLLWDH